MRGIVHTLSRLPSARVLIAGAAILAGAFTSAAHGQSSGSGNGNGTTPSDGPRGDETALAIPHFAGSAEVVLPRPLSAQDAAVMQRIFAAQAHGDIPQAIRYCSDLDDPLLLGTALASRYLGHHHRSSVPELTAWLARYPDLPDAPAIHALLASRLPKGATLPPIPQASPLPKYGPATEPDSIERDPVLDRTVLDRAARGATTLALRQLAARKGLPPAYARQLRAEIAQRLFIRNEDAAALNLAQGILRDAPGASPPLAFYIGGLSAWRLGRYDIAQTLFEGGATAADASPRLRAASAFWASRAARPLLDAAQTAKWLNVAAAEKLTFHGLIARKILRLDTEIIPQSQTISQADIDAVAALPGGRRAFALLQIGQNERAAQELRGLWGAARKDPVFGRSLMMVASFAGMADLAAQMADLLQDQDDPQTALPHLPLPRLRPAGGFRLDPPLVYALARVESNFDPGAISANGARGLLQIMPETAQFITGNVTLSAAQLHEPASNLAIGQRYLASLATIDGIGDDLIRILASYNAGPGNVLHWLPAMHDQDDPLLFIETIPVAETRAFVPAALTYAWLYAAQMHLPSPSLDAMAAGEFPRFTPENQESRIAAALN